MNLADADVVTGDPNMLLETSQAELARAPDDVAALEQEGDSDYALGRYGDAAAAYNRALVQNPSATAARIGLGRALLKSDPHGAETAFSAAVQTDPGNAAALNDLGIARDMQGNFAGAVAPYRQALQADPTLTAAQVNLGLSLALAGDGPDALALLAPLANGQGATPRIRADYAAALLADGQPRAAQDVLNIDLPPDQAASAMAGFTAAIATARAPHAG